MSAPVLAEGAKARLIRDVAEKPFDTYHKGFEFVVSEYDPAMSEDDPRRADPSYIHCAFYTGDANGGFNNVTVPADAVEEVMSAEVMRARKLPTVDEFASAVGSELCGMDEGNFYTDETNQEGDGLVLVAGETREGLRFAAYVRVESIFEADF